VEDDGNFLTKNFHHHPHHHIGLTIRRIHTIQGAFNS
jgi:hypothetical protein